MLLVCLIVTASAAASETDRFWQAVRDTGNVDSALPRLKTAFPDHFRNYTLVYHSRSLQPAMPLAPRVIAFGPDARFLFTYNGIPAADGTETLELIEYDGEANRFRFSEVSFHAGRAARLEKEPVSCERCHGYPARPRWDQYFLWPGVYGSEDDHLSYALTHEKGIEEKNFREFQSRRAGLARYALLEPFGQTRIAGSYSDRPNATLSELLGRVNGEYLAKTVLSRPALLPWRHAILAVFNGPSRDCFTLPGFFPPALEPRLRALFENVRAETEARTDAAFRAKVRRHRRLVGEAVGRARGLTDQVESSDFDRDQWVSLRFILEGLSALDMREWSLELSPRGYSLDVSGGLSMFEERLKSAVKLRFGLPDYDYFTGCETLRREHLRAFPLESPRTVSTLENMMRNFTEPPSPGPFASCVGCHRPDTEDSAPAIPFHNPDFLAEAIRQSPHLGKKILRRIQVIPPGGEKRMPPDGGPLPVAEREAIEAFVKSARAR